MDAPTIKESKKNIKRALKEGFIHLEDMRTDHRIVAHRAAAYMLGKINTAILNGIRLANAAPRMRTSETDYRLAKEYKRSHKKHSKNTLLAQENGVDAKPE